MRPEPHIWLLIALLGTGCAQQFDRQPASTAVTQGRAISGADLTPAELAALMSQVAAMDAAVAHRESVRLAAHVERRSVAERLQLAYLLCREPGAMEALRQADGMLEELIPALDNGDTRELARLLQRNIKLQLRLDEVSAKAAELNHKIQQIKGLEEELQLHKLTDDPTRAMPDQ